MNSTKVDIQKPAAVDNKSVQSENTVYLVIIHEEQGYCDYFNSVMGT